MHYSQVQADLGLGCLEPRILVEEYREEMLLKDMVEQVEHADDEDDHEWPTPTFVSSKRIFYDGLLPDLSLIISHEKNGCQPEYANRSGDVERHGVIEDLCQVPPKERANYPSD